ncbi:MAG TPA: hypothetical protein VF283_20265 [Bryobacteraceae bacterium]
MTPRSLRRAAERKARKLARKAEKGLLRQTAAVTEPDLPPPATEPDIQLEALPPVLLPEPTYPEDEAAPFSAPKVELAEAMPLSVPKMQTMSASPARLAANQANARLSTGPRTSAGKEICSLNALKTGLTGRTVLLPSEDAEQYRRHIDRFFAEYKPADDKERDLVQIIADTAWRLLRISALETNLFALGRVHFKDMFQDEAAELRPGLIEAHTLVAFQKQFTNLGIQESRLLRRFEKTRAELAALQSQRHEAAAPPRPTRSVGSEFSTPPVAHASACSGFSNPPAGPSTVSQQPRLEPRKLTANI